MYRFFDSFLCEFLFDVGSNNHSKLTSFGDVVHSTSCNQGVLCWIYLLFGFFGRHGPLLGLSGLDLGGFGPSFWKFLVPIFFTISKFFTPNIDFGFDFGTTCLHSRRDSFSRLCQENPSKDLSHLLRRKVVKTTMPTLKVTSH